MKKVKISMLGGSGVSTPELVHSLLERAEDLPEVSLVLHGRSEEKLQIVGSLCQRMARRASQLLDLFQGDQRVILFQGWLECANTFQFIQLS